MKRPLFVVFIGTAVLLYACGGGGAVKVTQRDYAIDLDPAAMKAGKIRFDIENEGSADHEFTILRTDLGVESLPLRDDDWVDESAAGIQDAGGFDHVFPDKPKDLELDLSAGNYVIICNIQGHYELGMRASFTVID